MSLGYIDFWTSRQATQSSFNFHCVRPYDIVLNPKELGKPVVVNTVVELFVFGQQHKYSFMYAGMITSTTVFVFFWILAAFDVSSASSGKYVGWTWEHQWCRLTVSTSSSLNPSPGSDVVCTNQPYFDYFKEALRHPPSPNHHQVAEVVVNMYSDLRKSIQMHTKTLREDSIIAHEFPFFAQDLQRRRDQDSQRPVDSLVQIFPISLSVPDDMILSHVPPKSKAFSRVVPGNLSSYFSMDEEKLFYDDIERSLFGWTCSKGGWDYIRHYEIIARGSLPLFLDISMLPPPGGVSTSLALHPTKLYPLLFSFPTLSVQAGTQLIGLGDWEISEAIVDYPSERFEKQLYSATVMALQQYAKNVLSTSAMASYVLQTVQQNVALENKVQLGRVRGQITRVLYLTHDGQDVHGDFQTDSLLHGLKTLLGQEASVVINVNRRSSVLRNLQQFDEASYRAFKRTLYAGGSTYGLALDTLSPDEHGLETIELDVDGVLSSIQRREFDVVIHGAAHRSASYKPDKDPKFAMLWSAVCHHYERHEVVLIDGSETGLSGSVLDRLLPCARHVFSREGIRLKN